MARSPRYRENSRRARGSAVGTRVLVPVERARILHLLIEDVRYNAEAGEVAITFRPGGVRSLARERNRSEHERGDCHVQDRSEEDA